MVAGPDWAARKNSRQVFREGQNQSRLAHLFVISTLSARADFARIAYRLERRDLWRPWRQSGSVLRGAARHQAEKHSVRAQLRQAHVGFRRADGVGAGRSGHQDRLAIPIQARRVVQLGQISGAQRGSNAVEIHIDRVGRGHGGGKREAPRKAGVKRNKDKNSFAQGNRTSISPGACAGDPGGD